MSLTFRVDGEDQRIDPDGLVIAGFTGRDQAAIEAHLEELRELGVPTPATTPSYYLAPPSAAVQTDAITCVQADTSGEAEAVVVFDNGRTWLTLGSDHTDRAAEVLDIALSKIVCPKPVAADAWRFEQVAAHLDRIELRSWVTIGSEEVLYQQGTLSEFMPLDEIIARAPLTSAPERLVLFTGTLAAIGGIRPATRFRATLTDPVKERTIDLDYRIEVLDLFDDVTANSPGGTR